MAAISGNDVFSHVTVGASDLKASVAFYEAALGALGIKNLGAASATCYMFGRDKPALLVLNPAAGGKPTSNGMTVGFQAKSYAEVNAFHAAGLKAGGIDEGKPGPRSSLPGAYAAYLRDPDGNKICTYAFDE